MFTKPVAKFVNKSWQIVKQPAVVWFPNNGEWQTEGDSSGWDMVNMIHWITTHVYGIGSGDNIAYEFNAFRYY